VVGIAPRVTGIIFPVCSDQKPKRKHLRRLEKVQADVKARVYFITVCTHNRKQILARDDLHDVLVKALREKAQEIGWRVGRYVIMPDHVHFFCALASPDSSLSKFIGQWKDLCTKRLRDIGMKGPFWQKEFFDHLLRSDESHKKKWEYVRHNPVRHRLCKSPDEWPYQGEIQLL